MGIFKCCKSCSIYFLAILGSNQRLMLTYFTNGIPLIVTDADFSPFHPLKNEILK
jgi:hypothetical protein